jgi:hypothetical protein
MKKKIERLKEFVKNLNSDLTKIGDEFKDVEDVIRKHKLYVFEKDGERNEYGDYWFNTSDGEFSGRISYDEDDDRYYVANDIQIWSDNAQDWVWEFDLGCSRLERLY